MKKTSYSTLFLKKPTRKHINAFIDEQKQYPLTYEEVGATRHMDSLAKSLAKHYRLAHYRFFLGIGEQTFERAKLAMQQWKMFELDWVFFCWPETPLSTNATVAIMAQNLGINSISGCRIVYTLDEKNSVHRFGFAMGTLPGHLIRGEERFLVEWNQKDNSVWYDVQSFSKKNKLLAELGSFHVHRLQKRFVHDSIKAIQKAIQGP